MKSFLIAMELPKTLASASEEVEMMRPKELTI